MRQAYSRRSAISHTVHSYSRRETQTLSGYNAYFISAPGTTMEAEQLNIIANRLTDLAQRTAELRRYL